MNSNERCTAFFPLRRGGGYSSGCHQGDQIRHFMKLIGYKFSCKSSPKYLVTFGDILKNICFKVKNTVWYFWATFRGNWAFLVQHLVTLVATLS